MGELAYRRLQAFEGCSRVVEYDNRKSAVLERHRQAIHFNPTLLALAGHYRYKPRPVAVARGNEKGRVERAIRYIRSAFFAARQFSVLADLNAQADAWCAGQAMDRPCPQGKSMTVPEAFQLKQPHLLGLPDIPFPSDEVVAMKAGKAPYVRFDGHTVLFSSAAQLLGDMGSPSGAATDLYSAAVRARARCPHCSGRSACHR